LSPFIYHRLSSGYTEAHCTKCDCAVFYDNTAEAELQGSALRLRCDELGREHTARLRARALGHTLSAFRQDPGSRIASCTRCGCAVILENNLKEASGTALSHKCADERAR
jgi:hypothetical protein